MTKNSISGNQRINSVPLMSSFSLTTLILSVARARKVTLSPRLICYRLSDRSSSSACSGRSGARVLTLNPLPYKTSCKKCVAYFYGKAAKTAVFPQTKVA
ncbi:hypothetical protein [Nostoc sp.]|uniref:hypothetical protein n=1 Tax=Nostoc sp. TaxID=1180 RepID=UPI002FF89E60